MNGHLSPRFGAAGTEPGLQTVWTRFDTTDIVRSRDAERENAGRTRDGLIAIKPPWAPMPYQTHHQYRGNRRAARVTCIEGKPGMINKRKMAALNETAVLVAFAGCAGEQPATQTESGTYSLTYDNVGGLIASRTGTGKLTLKDGSEYAITADRCNLAALSYTVATATGRVYNRGTPVDFNGEYGAVGGKLRNRGNDVLLDANST